MSEEVEETTLTQMNERGHRRMYNEYSQWLSLCGEWVTIGITGGVKFVPERDKVDCEACILLMLVEKAEAEVSGG